MKELTLSTVRYPDVLIQENNLGIKIWTTLRKQHTDEKWYLIKFMESQMYPEDLMDFTRLVRMADTINKLNREVYMFLLNGIIAPNIYFERETYAGKLTDIFELDTDQTPEKDRIRL